MDAGTLTASPASRARTRCPAGRCWQAGFGDRRRGWYQQPESSALEEALLKTGLGPEMRDNAREWRYDLEHTQPRLVSFCIDLDWALKGGQDPLALVRAAEGRIGSLHIRNSRKGIFLETVDEGDIDMAPIAAFLRQAQFNGYLVVELAREKETRVTHSLFEDLKHAHFYTQKVFGSRPGQLQVNM